MLQLTLAYETLSDEHKRREYDIMQYFIRQSRPTPQTMQTPRPSPASTPQTGAGSHGNQMGEAARTLESPRVVGMRARAVARVADARAEVAIERLRRLREARKVASIRQGYGGTPQARASVCYYEGEWEKLDGGALCPECLDVCTYQLRCPDCEAKACRRCQKEASLRFPHNTGKIARTALTKGREG
jgi:DnaJ-class molecular chaperone